MTNIALKEFTKVMASINDEIRAIKNLVPGILDGRLAQ
jgi:hypothetical protein